METKRRLRFFWEKTGRPFLECQYLDAHIEGNDVYVQAPFIFDTCNTETFKKRLRLELVEINYLHRAHRRTYSPSARVYMMGDGWIKMECRNLRQENTRGLPSETD